MPPNQATDTAQATGTTWLVTPAPSWYLLRHPNNKVLGLWRVTDPATNHRYVVIRRRPGEGNGNGGHEWDCDCPIGRRDGLCEHVEAVEKYCAESEPEEHPRRPQSGTGRRADTSSSP